jgi:hypothetical protein
MVAGIAKSLRKIGKLLLLNFPLMNAIFNQYGMIRLPALGGATGIRMFRTVSEMQEHGRQDSDDAR